LNYSTEIGDCPPVTGCVSGEQSTTRTTIATTIPVLMGPTETESGAQPTGAEEPDEETNQYFLGLFKQEHISIEDGQSLADMPKCSTELTGIPNTCFNALYPVFCSEVDRDASKDLKKTLTSADIPTSRKRSGSGVQRRTPPPNESTCNGWDFEFEWSGSDGNDCRKSCSEAFQSLSSTCAKPGPAGVFKDGSVPVGCGSYKYSISGEGTEEEEEEEEEAPPPTTTSAPPSTTAGPPSPPKTTIPVVKPSGPVQCYQKKEGCKYWDIPIDEAHSKTDTFCEDHGSQDAFEGSGWPGILDDSNDFAAGASYNFRVLWKPDCIAEGHDELNVGQPIPDFSCKEAMRMTFDQCNNGGRGGRVEVGCLEYYFHAINQACPIAGYCNEGPFGGHGSVC
jgi:hypothetical protein